MSSKHDLAHDLSGGIDEKRSLKAPLWGPSSDERLIAGGSTLTPPVDDPPWQSPSPYPAVQLPF